MIVNNRNSSAIEGVSKYGSLASKIIVVLGAVLFGLLIITSYSSWQDARDIAKKEQKEKVESGDLTAFDESRIADDPQVIDAREYMVTIIYLSIITSIVFVCIGLAFALMFGTLFLIINFKRNYKILISFGLLALVILIAAQFNTGLTENMSTTAENVDAFWLSVGETGIYSAFIFICLAIVGSLASFVVRLVK